LRALAVPVAWNLAGGYRRDAGGSIRPVLDIHDNTMVAFAETLGLDSGVTLFRRDAA
jgi:hypothetical protein